MASDGRTKRTGRPSLLQQQILLEELERRPNLATGALSPQFTYKDRQKGWAEVAALLNSIAHGVVKTNDQWRKSWSDWKSSVRTKVRNMSHHVGEMPAKPLTELEDRLRALIDPVLSAHDNVIVGDVYEDEPLLLVPTKQEQDDESMDDFNSTFIPSSTTSQTADSPNTEGIPIQDSYVSPTPRVRAAAPTKRKYEDLEDSVSQFSAVNDTQTAQSETSSTDRLADAVNNLSAAVTEGATALAAAINNLAAAVREK